MAVRGWGAEPSRTGFAAREPEQRPVPGGSRTYRMGWGFRAFLWAAAAGFAVAAVAAGRSQTGGVVPAVVFAGFALLGAIAATGMARTRVTIDDSWIEYVEWKKPRRVGVEQIRGFRTLQAKNVTYLVFEAREPGGKKLKIPRMGTMDAAFAAWLARIPDLDAADRVRSEAELLRSRALGASPVERTAALSRAHTVSRALNGLALAVSLWAMLFPRPWEWAVGTAFAAELAAIALLLARPGVFQILGARNDARPQLVGAVFMPGIACAIRAFDFELLAPAQLLVPALLGGAALCSVALVGDAAIRRKPVWLLLVLPFFAGQAAGAATIANCFRDASTATEYRAEVVGKYQVRGKGASWNLRLAPWGPRAEGGSLKVSPALYDAVSAGDRVVVRVRDGRLGMPWLRVVARCP